MTSSNANKTNVNEWVQWIEDSISKECISHHDYDEFQNIQQIGFGAFSKVYRATWKSSDTVVTIKSFKNSKFVVKEIVNEVYSLHKVNCF